MSFEDLIRIRNVRKSDIPCIASNWLKSFRNAPASYGIPNSIFYDQHHRVLETLLVRSTVLVLCNESDTDQILGWVCAEVMDTALVVHYLYIKSPFRRMGLAKRLLDKLFEVENPPALIYTHRTRVAGDILKHRETPIPFVYNPYLLWTSLPEDWHRDAAEKSESHRARSAPPQEVSRSFYSTSRLGAEYAAEEAAKRGHRGNQ